MNTIDDLIVRFHRLSTREKLLVGLAGGATMVVLLYFLIWDPLVQKRENTARAINAKEQELVEVLDLRERYLEVNRQLEALRQVVVYDPPSSLFALVEDLVDDAVSSSSIRSMTPGGRDVGDLYREETVAMRLKGISLGQLVSIMHAIEKNGKFPLRISSLQVKKLRKDPRTFDVNATVSMVTPRGRG